MKKRFNIKNIKQGGTTFSNYQQYGVLCIKSLDYGVLMDNQLEAVRRFLIRKIKRKGIIWIRVQCRYPVTKKSAGSRMGKGVGPVKFYIANIKKGRIILELQALITKELITFFKKLILKLPVKACVLLKTYY
jgi:large subunit ribosomal protein L16